MSLLCLAGLVKDCIELHMIALVECFIMAARSLNYIMFIIQTQDYHTKIFKQLLLLTIIHQEIIHVCECSSGCAAGERNLSSSLPVSIVQELKTCIICFLRWVCHNIRLRN